MRNTVAITLFSFIAMGLLVAGCGGGSDGDASGSGSSEEPIDKAAFVEQANAICEQASGKITAELTAAIQKEAARPGPNPGTLQITLTKQSLAPGFEAELAEIRALGMPSEGKSQVKAFLGAIEKLAAKANSDPKGFNETVNPYEPAELAARRYGITACPVVSVQAG